MSKRKRDDSRAEPEAVIYRKPKKNDQKHGGREATESNTTRQSFKMAPQLGTHIFFLFIGSPCEALTLHSDLLAPATKTYLLTRFGAQQLCYMPEEDPSIANLWRLYLYTGKIYSDNEAADQDDPDDGGTESHADGEWTKLAHAYFFGQMIRDKGFANACVTALIEKVKATERFPTGIASEVYWYTQPRDGLRKLIVDLHVWMGEGTCVVEPHEDAEAPEDFVEDFRREMAWAEAVEWQAEWKWETNPCAYHSHVLTRRC